MKNSFTENWLNKCERMAARGQVQVVPQQALEPGEYAIVLRAIHPGKSSQGGLGGPAEQTVFFPFGISPSSK